jgi:Aldehyde dehydrogenase family
MHAPCDGRRIGATEARGAEAIGRRSTPPTGQFATVTLGSRRPHGSASRARPSLPPVERQAEDPARGATHGSGGKPLVGRAGTGARRACRHPADRRSLAAGAGAGPSIRPPEAGRVHARVGEATGRGAQPPRGGEALSATCHAPTVPPEPPPDRRVSTRELFGPVVRVHAHDGMDEAIGRADAPPWAYQAAVPIRGHVTTMHARTRLDASAVMPNDRTASRVDRTRRAGPRRSGPGVGGIPSIFRETRTEKMSVGPMP